MSREAIHPQADIFAPGSPYYAERPVENASDADIVKHASYNTRRKSKNEAGVLGVRNKAKQLEDVKIKTDEIACAEKQDQVYHEIAHREEEEMGRAIQMLDHLIKKK